MVGLLPVVMLPGLVFVLGLEMLPFLLIPLVMLVPGLLDHGDGSSP